MDDDWLNVEFFYIVEFLKLHILKASVLRDLLKVEFF